MGIFRIMYQPKALKQYSKFPNDLKDAYKQAFSLLADSDNHQKLKVHKLHGELKDSYAASVDYAHRIVFKYYKDAIVVVLVGNHSIYN